VLPATRLAAHRPQRHPRRVQLATPNSSSPRLEFLRFSGRGLRSIARAEDPRRASVRCSRATPSAKTFYANGFLTFTPIVLSVFSGATRFHRPEVRAFPPFRASPRRSGRQVRRHPLPPAGLHPGAGILLLPPRCCSPCAWRSPRATAGHPSSLVECLCLASPWPSPSSAPTPIHQIAIFLVCLSNTLQMLGHFQERLLSWPLCRQHPAIGVRREAGLSFRLVSLLLPLASRRSPSGSWPGASRKRRRLMTPAQAEKRHGTATSWASATSTGDRGGITGLLGPNGAGRSTF
jgi:hypothetical protein